MEGDDAGGDDAGLDEFTRFAQEMDDQLAQAELRGLPPPPEATGVATLPSGAPNRNPLKRMIARAMLNTYYSTKEPTIIVNDRGVDVFLVNVFNRFIKALLTTQFGQSVEAKLGGKTPKEKEKALADYILDKFSEPGSSHIISKPYPLINGKHPLFQMFVELMSAQGTKSVPLPLEVENFQRRVREDQSSNTHQVGKIDHTTQHRAVPRPGRPGCFSCASKRRGKNRANSPPRRGGGGKKKRKRNKTIRKKIIKRTKRVKRTRRVKRTKRR